MLFFVLTPSRFIDADSSSVSSKSTENQSPVAGGGGGMSFLDQLKLKQQQKMNKGEKDMCLN